MTLERSTTSKMGQKEKYVRTDCIGDWFANVIRMNFVQVVKKTFVEELVEGNKKAPNQVAGEILSFFTRNNFSVVDKGETIT